MDVSSGGHVLIVDDIATAVSSIRETIRTVDRLGGVVIGIGVLETAARETWSSSCLCSVAFGLPTEVCSPEGSALCAGGIPLVKPGAQG